MTPYPPATRQDLPYHRFLDYARNDNRVRCAPLEMTVGVLCNRFPVGAGNDGRLFIL